MTRVRDVFALPHRMPPVVTAWLLLTVAAFVFGAGPSWAADDKKAKDAQRRQQQQTQQLMAEKSRLEQEKASLSKEKEDLTAAAEKTAAALARAEGLLRAKARAEAELAAKHAELERSHEELKRLQAETLRQAEADKKRLEAVQAEQRGIVGRQVAMLQACEGRNAKLYQTGSELLQKYREKSCLGVALEADPVTGLGKVEAENMLQRYLDLLDAGKSATAAR
jgi:flagellar biosynthesis GTPase FlhF